ncbi:histidine phosphatase family protein [Pseudalkalibacillus caeni]|uniref:histidine phosphatase family protein n=1 Tax=Exobacillus caeni TaxID=2574798 RepID=UPI001FECF902|nr:histidine phosphatase family protein [Pseudalkalibacillus caeni]
MDFLFIRHGQCEHTINTPESLHITDPELTRNRITQAKALIEKFPLKETDMVVFSPVRRTLQTAAIWTDNTKCKKIVSPLVAPRMFPRTLNGKSSHAIKYCLWP